ncbi:MAG: GxxExxY protein [Patescibacteria group bacterium]|nr:GxxExxY protein [Patescibacteria group bacterium]MDD4610892.1 GxxExxY protein [Patescibacteria group bacterium]
MSNQLVRKDIIYPELSYKIIGILFEVYNELGFGYQEKYYQKAIEAAFTKLGVKYKSQCSYLIRFNGKLVGRYFMDFVIEDKIVLEIKIGDYYAHRNFNQVKGYLHATNYKLGILANFTSSGLKYKRVLNIK